MPSPTGPFAPGWRVLDSNGRLIETRAAPTKPMPAMHPGAFFMERLGEWYLIVDSNLWWNGTDWEHSGTIIRVPDPQPPEPQIYDWRRDQLRLFGWIT